MADKITKLSQAIRLGATFRPQCVYGYYERGGSCALGAAAEAIAGEKYMDCSPLQVIKQRFNVPMAILSSIIRQNDAGRTREQIAEHLEAQGL